MERNTREDRRVLRESEDQFDAYAVWLQQRRLAPHNQVPFFVRWVQRFQRLFKTRAGDTWQDTLQIFLENLAEGQTPDWQIRQAADAVTLYYDQFQASRGITPVKLKQSTGLPYEREVALAEMRRLLQLRHYSPRTKRTYLGWVDRYMRYIGDSKTAPPTSADVKAYLSHLATRAKVSASTQNQAFNALLFLHRNVFQTELIGMASTLRARQGKRLPLVLSQDEVKTILTELNGRCRIMVELIYGSSLRLNEAVLLRIKDIDIAAGSVTVRSGTGDNVHLHAPYESPRSGCQ